MAKMDFAEVVSHICTQDPRYLPEAYAFVREGLDFTLKLLKTSPHSGKHHVSGQELLVGLREYALREFGPMSKTVLNEWGVKTCEDFGAIVFNLVNAGVLGKTETDSIADFRDGFSFDEAFVRPFKPVTPAAIGERRKPQKRPSRALKKGALPQDKPLG